MTEKPCPKCGAPVRHHMEDLCDEAVDAGACPDEWVECTKCDYAETLEFHEEEDEGS